MVNDATTTALDRDIMKQAEEVQNLTVGYVATEESFFAHTSDVLCDELEPGAKEMYTKKMNELSKSRDVTVQKVAESKKMWEITRSLMPMTGEEARSTNTNSRIATIPPFRRDGKPL